MKRSAAAAMMRVSKRRFGVQEVRPAVGRTALGGSASGAVADAADAIFADAKAFLDSPEAGQMNQSDLERELNRRRRELVGSLLQACRDQRNREQAAGPVDTGCRERRAVRARRRGIDLRRGAGRAPGRHAVRHWPADAGRYRVAGTAAQAVITVFDRIHGKAVREAAAVFGHGSRPSRRAAGRCDSGGGIRSGVFMQRQDLRAASRAVSVYPPVRDAQQRLRAR